MTNPIHLTISQTAPAPATEPTLAAPHRVSAFDLVAAQPWAMTPAMLHTISAIARRENESPEAVEARLGRPLQNTQTVSMRGGVAIVPLVGPVMRYANIFSRVSGATSLETLAQEFTAALDDPAVTAIVLNIDSPGGQANGIAEFASMVRAAKKPVVAYVDGSAASAAYWVAAAAQKIVLAKTAEVGSIGAVVAIDASKKATGVIEIVSSQSPKKRIDPSTDDGRSQIQTRIDAFAQVFIEDVAAYRGVSVATVLEKFGQGDMRMGADAVALGMADEVSTLEDVIAALAGKPQTLPAQSKSTFAKGATAMNIEELKAAHPDLCAALIEEGRSAGLEAGASAERSRILDVEAQALPGHEALVAAFKA
ncbi:MAG TPA: S49 family peptidase, partial [Rhodocyclaceae bacterium]|nr:S49 family peptidase [Rhodocyclaceae bacterium]